MLFSKVFGSSPILPLQDHMSTVHETVEQLSPFFEFVFTESWREAESTQLALSDTERKADEMKRDIRQHLPKSLFLPVARSDLLELLSMQDKIANTAKDVAGLVIGRKMNFFPDLQEKYREYLSTCIAVSRKAKDVILKLDDLLEMGFNEASITEVNDELKILANLESETDRQQVKLRRLIFDYEKQVQTPAGAINVMFYYRVIELTGAIADFSEKVGDRLQILLAR